jgi:hypothetical protein
MEELFEFLFGASGRIDRAKYWRSLLVFCGAGSLVGVILLIAAGLAAPLFILMLATVFIPCCSGASLSTLSDCMTGAKAHGGCWCSMPCRECWVSWRKVHSLLESLERGCTTSWRWQALRSRFGDLLKSAACAATPDSTDMAQIRLQCMPPEVDYSAAKAVAQLKS